MDHFCALGYFPSRLHEQPSLPPIQAALDGDRAALAEVVRVVLAAVKVEVALCLHRRAGAQRRDVRQDIDDFSHEVLLALLAERGRLLRMWTPERGTLSGFVRMIARQRVSRILQGHRGNPWSEDPTEQDALEPLVEAVPGERLLESREELRALLERLSASLSERGIQLFQRIFGEQRPIAEVAVEFGMERHALKLGAVDSRHGERRGRPRRTASCWGSPRCRRGTGRRRCRAPRGWR